MQDELNKTMPILDYIDPQSRLSPNKSEMQRSYIAPRGFQINQNQSLDNITYIAEDQNSVNKAQAKGMWSSIPKAAIEYSFWEKWGWIPGFSRSLETELFRQDNVFSQRVHYVCAPLLNILILASAPHQLQIFRGNLEWVIYFLISAISTYCFVSNVRTYQIFDFEQIFLTQGGQFNSNIYNLKRENPRKFYQKIKTFFEEKYGNTSFEFQFVDNQNFSIETDSEIFIKNIQNLVYGIPNAIWFQLRKLWIDTQNEQIEKFIQASDSGNQTQFMLASVWENNEIYNLYFLYTNPIFVFCAAFNGWQIFVIDIIVLILIDKISELTQSSLTGERIISSVTKNDVDISNERQRQKKEENGKIIAKYLKMKMKNN